MKYLTILPFLIMSCFNGDSHNTGAVWAADTPAGHKNISSNPKTNTTVKDPLDQRKCVVMNSATLNNNDSLFQFIYTSFTQDLGNLPNAGISAIKKSREGIEIEGFGKCNVFTITLSGDLPAMLSRKMNIVYNYQNSKLVLLPFESVFFVSNNQSPTQYFLAGVNEARTNGFFIIYSYNSSENLFRLVFDSNKEGNCENGIPVMNASLDCISYEPFLLNFENKDVNGDGLKDISFSGKVNHYCEGLETNIGRLDRKPVKSENVEIIFLAEKQGDQIFWKLSDTTICKKINQ